MVFDELLEKKNIEEEMNKDLMVLKNKKKMMIKWKKKFMELVIQCFIRLELFLSGFYCEEWVEECLLDYIVEWWWGVNVEVVYVEVDVELNEEQ